MASLRFAASESHAKAHPKTCSNPRLSVENLSFMPVFALVPAMVVSLVLLKLNQHLASPGLGIVNRWLRQGVLAGGAAVIVLHFGWSERPYTVLFFACLIGWFFLETVYHWLSIHAMSVSPLPLFPRFTVNRGGDEWPVQARFLKLRDRIRDAGFKHAQAIRAEVATSLYVRASIYQDNDESTRLQVTFLPQAMGNMTVCLHMSTQTADGRRVVTDNHHLPFAGFYPESWIVERNPWQRSFSSLLARHRIRVADTGSTPVKWENDPLIDVNAQQSELERLNTQLGFLLPGADHEEHGRISPAGRYRVWKEMLSLNYLGRAARYD
jgi:hypothetical protein